MNEDFKRHLDYCSKVVSTWPEWKQRVLGCINQSPDEIKALRDWNNKVLADNINANKVM